MSKIGVGITTTDKRPKHRDYWFKLLESGLFEGMKIYFAHNHTSVAEAKNDCLRSLSDCDYVFLFDDDTFPFQHDWADFFIKHSIESGNQHFSYLRSVHHIRLAKTVGSIGVYNNSAGCMMFMTKACINAVGGYDERFKTYGYEHVNYSDRIHKSGATGSRNVCPIGAEEYVYSMDMDAWKEFDFIHHPTLSPDVMYKSVGDNHKVFTETEPTIYLPL